MILKKIIIVSLILLTCFAKSQTVGGVYKINDLLNRIKNKDTTYVVNFWATWCKPCVQELPAFDSLFTLTKNSSIKIILVSLDFKEDIETKVNTFLMNKNMKSEVVLLDEINGNDYINKISEKWSGAIPATLIKNIRHSNFIENKVHLKELQKQISDVTKK
ncbi:MAG: TlpA disulfide reductase family protein [Bacteroidota bacterium]|nr:TlpA disulfide reductase family protein [Bacteroidota bacterium]